MSKVKRFIPVAAIVLAAAALTGCSGINASRSVSPASFILPGLIQNDPTPAGALPNDASVEQIALLTDSSN